LGYDDLGLLRSWLHGLSPKAEWTSVSDGLIHHRRA
jgi:hypothetical protein